MAQIEGNVKVNVNANQAEAEMQRLERKASELRQEIIKIRKEKFVDERQVRHLEKELRSVEKAQKELRRSANDYKKVLQNLSGASLRDLNKAYRQLSYEVSKLERGTEQWKRKASDMAKVKAEIGKVRQKMRDLERGTQKSRGGIGKLADGFNRFGGVALSAVAGVTATLSGLILVIRKIVNAIMEWEDSFTDVLTLMSSDDIAKFGDTLEQGALDIMSKYGLATKDVNKALFDTISAGVSAADAIDVLDAAAQLAIGGTTDLSTATDGLTTVMNAFHLSAAEATDVANAFFTAQKYGKTTVEELATNVGKVAPVMNAAGLSYQETLAVLAELTKNGISTAESTTYLKGAITSLLKPTEEATKVLREYNVPVGATEIKQAGLTKTLAAFNDMMDKNPDVVAKAMPNLQGLTGIMALTGDSFEDFQVILDQVNTDIGEGSSLMEAYGIKTSTASFKMKTAQANLRASTISLREELMPFMVDLLAMAKKWTDRLTKFVSENTDSIKKFFKVLNYVITNGILPFIKGFKALGDVISKVTKLFNKSAEAMEEIADATADIEDVSQTIETTTVQNTETTETNVVIPELIGDTGKTTKAVQDQTAQLEQIIMQYRAGLISDAEEKARQDVEIWRRAEEEKIKNMKASAEKKAEAMALIEETYQKKMADIDKKYAAEREKKVNEVIKFLEAQELALHGTREQLMQADIAKIEAKYDKEIELAKKLADDNPAIRADMLARIEELEKLKADEIAEYKRQKEEELERQKLEIRRKYGLESEQERMQEELDQLEEYYQQKLLSEEEYQEIKAGIEEKYRVMQLNEERRAEQEKMKMQEQNINDSMAVIGAFEEFFKSAKEDELRAAGDNEEKKKEIAKRYADVEMAITIAKIIANTALAVMKATAELGPVAGPIAATVITATGVMQVGTAIAQRNRIKGMASGGLWVEREQDGRRFYASRSDRRGYVSSPTILVGEEGPEYVIPSEGLQNRYVLNFVRELETARQSGQLRSFEPPQIRGYAEGGATQTVAVQSDDNSEVIAKLDLLIAKFDDFSQKIDSWATNLRVDYDSFRKTDALITKTENYNKL